ncbi:MAG: helix-turn-helix transcriptional regulator [Akkermansia sp.]|nr:helix-turn-helix transcriptional regulator [Akkermansia sp.]
MARCQMMEWMISRATLAKIEGGFRRVNDAEVSLLARALNTTPNALLDQPLPRLLDTARHGEAPDIDLMAADGEE